MFGARPHNVLANESVLEYNKRTRLVFTIRQKKVFYGRRTTPLSTSRRFIRVNLSRVLYLTTFGVLRTDGFAVLDRFVCYIKH